MSINASLPQSLRAGDSWIFQDSEPDYPPSGGWSLSFALSLDGKNKLAVTATASGSNYIFTITPDTTKQLVPAVYDFALFASKSSTSERYTVSIGALRVLPNLAADRDPTTAEKMLSAIESALLKLLAGTNASISINGQSYTKKDVTQLLNMRARLQAEVDNERNALDERDRINIEPRFTPSAGTGFVPWIR